MERINLTSNKAKNGGAIVNIGTFSLTSCCLAENKAEISGGAVFNKGNIISINFNNFTTNQATNGGTLYNEGGGIYVGNENIFNKNKAKIGGAINNQAGSIQIDSPTKPNIFNNNTVYGKSWCSNKGGAIYNNAFLDVKNSHFIKNNANDGLNFYNEKNGELNIVNCYITTTNPNNDRSSSSVDSILNSGKLNIHYSVLIEGDKDINQIENSRGTVHAENNFWSGNRDPVGTFFNKAFIGNNVIWFKTGKVYATPWLVLDVNQKNSSDGLVLTADLLHNNKGEFLDPVYGHVPDGLLVEFKFNNGTVISAPLVNGQAQITLTNIPKTVEVKFNNQEKKITLKK